MLGHFLQFSQGSMNMYLQKKVQTEAQKKAGELLNSDYERVYLFNTLEAHRKSTKCKISG